jgi:XTP/dITP diphosphohydrolase
VGAPKAEVVLASANAGKLRELRALLAGLPVRVVGLDELPGVELPEEGEDYATNAIAKARAVAAASRRPALGDDSGIEVEALGGAPGPRSARFGPDAAARNRRLLEALAGVATARRGARFVCVVALATPNGDVATARGECAGRILSAPRGAGGFGYDPVFEPLEAAGRSMAELSPAEKHRLSHRGRAVRALLPAIERVLAAQRP